jgi:undecaprenyl diphosphate synthase
MIWAYALIAYQAFGAIGLSLFRIWLRGKQRLEPNLAGSYDWAWGYTKYAPLSLFPRWMLIRLINPLCLTTVLCILIYQKLRLGHGFLSSGDCPQTPNCSNYAIGALFRMPYMIALKRIKHRIDNCMGSRDAFRLEASSMVKRPISSPPHVGIIMDGNRRWAKQHGIELSQAYEIASSSLSQIVRFFRQFGSTHLTLFAFSRENANRSTLDREAVLHIFNKKIVELHNEMKKGNSTSHVQFIGDLSILDSYHQQLANEIMSGTREKDSFVLTIAFNYSGRTDILEAANAVLGQKDVDELSFKQCLATKNLPNVDLVIRTGGEQRLSNFLMWETAYSELCFTQTLFPGLNWLELAEICSNFSHRKRNFGM